jgi:signal transduction histidine kinase
MHERAELMGGWVQISSDLAGGTEIRAVFPLERIRPEVMKSV